MSLSLLLQAASAAAADGKSNSWEWKTVHAVGRFLNSEPPRPDQIFKIQYGAINGTVESFDIQQQIDDILMHNGVAARVGSLGNDGGALEIRFPRNFPYSNSGSGSGQFVFFVDEEDRSSENSAVTTDCFFVFSVPFSDSTEIEMAMPSILTKSPYKGDDIPNTCIPETTVQGVPVRKDGTISPWQQFKAGVAAEDVVCRKGLELVVSLKGRPYCAMPASAEALAERWS